MTGLLVTGQGVKAGKMKGCKNIPVPGLSKLHACAGRHLNLAELANILMFVHRDLTLYNLLECLSLHPVQGSIAYVQYSKSPTKREVHARRASFEVDIAYIKFLEMFEERQNII